MSAIRIIPEYRSHFTTIYDLHHAQPRHARTACGLSMNLYFTLDLGAGDSTRRYPPERHKYSTKPSPPALSLEVMIPICASEYIRRSSFLHIQQQAAKRHLYLVARTRHICNSLQAVHSSTSGKTRHEAATLDQSISIRHATLTTNLVRHSD